MVMCGKVQAVGKVWILHRRYCNLILKGILSLTLTKKINTDRQKERNPRKFIYFRLFYYRSGILIHFVLSQQTEPSK
uniref:Uncharacterized protein n=1 Tax=Pararge aegeria TaxID=116150 RepID=S4NVD7_9NEOP